MKWHRGELFPLVGFIVNDMSAGPEAVVRFYNGRGTAEQRIMEGKYALNWTRLIRSSRGGGPCLQELKESQRVLEVAFSSE